MEDYSRGLRGRVGNAVGVLKRAWVRIPCLPFILKKIPKKSWVSFFLYACFITRVNFLKNIKQQFHIEDGQDNGNDITKDGIPFGIGKFSHQ